VGAWKRGDAVRVAAEVVEAVFNAHIVFACAFLDRSGICREVGNASLG
jgi:hypothetical protein